MSSARLWRAVADQAAAWADTPTLRRFTRDLPRNAAGRPKGLPELLQRAQAGAGFVDAQPLRLATLLPLAAQASEDIDTKAMEADHRDWLAATTKAESAHRATIAWLRARLPGYPALPAPQLTSGSPLRTHEFTPRLIWTPGERGLGLQFEDPRPEIAQALGADEQQRRRLDETAREVAAALAASAEWQRLAAATDALDEEARTALGEVRTRLRDRLSPEMVDYHQPAMALRRAGYRKAVVEQEVAGLTGAAGEYAAAFETADLLVEVAASDVFAQLTCYRTPTLKPRDLEVHDGEPTRATFTLDEAGPVVPESGMLAWLADPQVPDAVLLTRVALQWDGQRTTRDVRASVLDGSAEAWRSGQSYG